MSSTPSKLQNEVARAAALLSDGATVQQAFSATAPIIAAVCDLSELSLICTGAQGETYALVFDSTNNVARHEFARDTDLVSTYSPSHVYKVSLGALYGYLCAVPMRPFLEATTVGLLRIYASLLAGPLSKYEDLYTVSAVFEDAPVPMVCYDPRTETILACNGALDREFGYRAGDLDGADLARVLPPHEQQHVSALMSEGGATFERSNCRLRKRDGTFADVEFRTRATIWNGAPAKLATVQDVTQHVRLEHRLLDAEKRLAAVQTLGHVGIYEVDLRTGERRWSKELCRQIGLAPGAGVPQGSECNVDYIHPDDRAAFQLAHERAIGNRTGYGLDHRILCSDGSIRWINTQADIEYEESGTPTRLVGTTIDITERKHAEDKLGYLALYDALTGLPNRSSFVDRVRQALALAKRYKRNAALLCVDMDGFKQINDIHGHDAGDAVLREVAARLRGCLRESDCVARIAGDEFLILLSETGSSEVTQHIASRVSAALAQPYSFGEVKITSSAAIGVAQYNDSRKDVDALIRHADLAMNEAKRSGGARIVVYEHAIGRLHQERITAERDLRRALENNELFVEYQPIVSIAGEKLLGAEALIRWRHPEGLRPPNTFIPIAEQSDLILAIGDWIMEEACRQAVAWSAARPAFTMAVNVSYRQLVDPMFVSRVKGILQRTGIGPSQLEIELTETALISDLEAVKQTLWRLRDLGIRIAIDDFGTGYNSLANLRHCRVDTLKIDRSFVNSIVSNASDKAIAGAVVSAGRSLGTLVTAEGVEDRAQLEALRHLGCDRAQGYLFARPLSPEDFEATILRASEVA